MDELEIKIALRYKVPENDLTLNGILQGLKEDQNMLMRSIVKTILSALEEKTVEKYKSAHPDRYYRHGRQPRARKLITSFGPVHYRLTQLYDRQTKNVFPPLVNALSILPYKQYQREALEAAVGQVIHLSYRIWGRKRCAGLWNTLRAGALCIDVLKSWLRAMGNGHLISIETLSF